MNKINKLMANVERILAIEAIVSLQGIDRQRPLKSSPTVENLYRKLRKIVPCLDENSSLNLHLERMVDYINNNNLAE